MQFSLPHILFTEYNVSPMNDRFAYLEMGYCWQKVVN